MNFGKKSSKKKQSDLTSKKATVGKRFAVIFFKTFIICIIAAALIIAIYGIKTVKDIIDEAPNIEEIDASPTGYLSTVLDAEGNEIATLVASGSNRVYVTLDEIPEVTQHAFVAIEDERFYTHNGIDLRGIVRALFRGVSSGLEETQGASTITQQLLKNNVFTDWTEESGLQEKLIRKIQEMYLAVQLEKVKSKDWILENYLNTINLGQNCLGVQAAAKRYFGKDVSELNLSESSVIAAITQNPSKYNPISHPDKNAERRDTVLQYMLEQGYVTQAEYDEAMEDDVYERIQVVNIETEENDEVYSYFVDELTDQVIDDLQEELGYNETQAYKALYSGGLTVYSTQDPEIQEICDDEINDLSNYAVSTEYSFSFALTIVKADGTYENYDENTMLAYYKSVDEDYEINFSTKKEAKQAVKKYKKEIMEDGDEVLAESMFFTVEPQASVTIIDQSTGEVKAIVGGRGKKTASKTLNRATKTTRQPGSTFKVLAAFAPALDVGGMTLASVQDDAPYKYSNGTTVHNYDSTYRGFTTIREAITKSINIVTTKTLKAITPEVGYEYLQNFGFTTLTDSDIVESLALGGVTNGVTNLELTAAYATIANGGTYTKPRFYTKILDHDGNVLIDNTPKTHTVLKETTAWLLTDAMKDVMTKGTGTPAAFDGMTIAGKSGTTTSNRDALFAGFTPYYTCVVWGGYDDNTPLPSTTYPKNIWREVMKRIHENLKDKDFEKPSGIVKATVCKKSGLLGESEVCSNDPRGSMLITEFFAEGTVPTEYCDHHISVEVCSVSGLLATKWCPEDALTTRVFMTGCEPGSADSEYAYSELGKCDVHSKNTVEEEEEELEEEEENTIDGETEEPEETEEPVEEEEPEETEEPVEEETVDIVPIE